MTPFGIFMIVMGCGIVIGIPLTLSPVYHMGGQGRHRMFRCPVCRAQKERDNQ